MENTPTEKKIYKSPRRKLVRFFEKSRDQWKEKCREAKARIRVLSNRVRFLEKGREKLKNQVRELRAELARMKSEERKKAEEDEILKKKLMRMRLSRHMSKNLRLFLSATVILSPICSCSSPWFCHRRHVSGVRPAPLGYSYRSSIFPCLLHHGIRAVCGFSVWDITSL